MVRSRSIMSIRSLLIGVLSIGIVLNVVYNTCNRKSESIKEIQINNHTRRERSEPWSVVMDDEIEMILQGLSIREKIAQMTQLDIAWVMNGHDRDPATALNRTAAIQYAKWGIGSILNSPFPVENISRSDWTAAEWHNITDQLKAIYKQYSKTPMIYGIDTIHGGSFIRNATLFPQPLSAGASFRPDLIYKMGEIEAKDTIDGGIPWVFSPVLGIAVQPKWSRVYETFGEDPYLASVMGSTIIRGIQASGRVAACMKHFIGYSNVVDGLDRTDSEISDFDLLNYYAPSFLAAVKAGVKTAMETYISINGEPVIASNKILTQLLRNDMKFEGMMVSDYSEVDRLVFEHHGVATVEEANRIVFNRTSLDMNMGPNPIKFMDSMERFVRSGDITEERLDESVRRILVLKKNLGLLDEHRMSHERDVVVEVVEKSPSDQEVALEIARESIVLVENNGSTLPIQLNSIDKDATIFLTGPTSDNIGYMCGGWSVWWQGSSDSSVFPYGMTLKDALIQRTKNTGAHIEHLNVVDVDGHFDKSDFDMALKIAARSKYTVVALGEGNYAEKSGDINDLSLPTGQLEYLRALIKIKSTKVILVLVSGRPRTLEGAHLGAAAALVSFLPCEQGGQALSEVLFGDINPSGKLPITYPKDSGNTMPYFHRVNVVCNPWENCAVEWPFFHGLSYTTFNQTIIPPKAGTPIQLKITNTGNRPGSEVAALFVHQANRLINVPEVWKLKAFEKVLLAPGESKIVSFNIPDEELFGYYVPQIGEGFRMQVDSDSPHLLYYGSVLPDHPDVLKVRQNFTYFHHMILGGDTRFI